MEQAVPRVVGGFGGDGQADGLSRRSGDRADAGEFGFHSELLAGGRCQETGQRTGDRGTRQADPVEVASFEPFEFRARQLRHVTILVDDELFV